MYSQEVYTLLTETYTLLLATTDQDFEAVKKLRREVSLEKYKHFATIENEEEFLFNPDDAQSFIYLIQHTKTKEYVGTVRVYFRNHRTPKQKLPMQHYSQSETIDELSKNLPICEISRLALSRKLIPHHLFSALELRTYLSMLLMTSTRINFFLYHYTALFSIMEPSLLRILKRQKVNFNPIGDPVDYYGICIPFATDRQSILQDTEETMGEVTRYYLQKLCKNSKNFWNFIDNNPYLDRSDIHLEKICKLFQKHGNNVELALLIKGKEDSTMSYSPCCSTKLS